MIYKTSNGIDIEVVVIRKKNKNLYFRVKEDLKLYVSAPMYLSAKSILNLIKENESSILKMYEETLDKSKDNDKFMYLGKKYYIEYKDQDEVTFDETYVYAKNAGALEKFYNSEVRRIFTEEVEIAKKCFSHLPEFTLKFRKMKTRWGVCNTAKKTVTLNTELLKKEIPLLDYVIVHELCHFFEGNHGKNFWALVAQAYPNYKEARKKLRY
ncbi:MAG TPA: M48 family metallopeptidase [Candidatus Onthocola stercorigallinarum]|nr:M48 family metallopeptidase [Candidatus Onthocola stercorigallinarum]